MKKLTTLLIGLSLALGALSGAVNVNAQVPYAAPATDTAQDFHIDKDGNATINQAKVYQIAGTTLYIRYYFGLAFIRVLVKTDANTRVFRRFGDQILLSDVHQDDILNIQGKVESGSDSLNVVASKIVNFSNQKEITGFKGTIAGNGSTVGSFVLATKNQGNVTIQTDAKTQIKKGTRLLNTGYVHTGDEVIDTTGTFDHGTQTLAADVIVIYTDMSVYKEQNFQGTLKAITTAGTPTITFTWNGKDYSVTLVPNAEIMNNKRKPVSLQRFVAGDTVRIYGNIREVDDPIIDAQVIRNLDL